LEPRDIHSLSSGEQQLVVILTHIAFNPAAQAANVLIIDEPELSLHVVWQEFFVDAIREVNPNLQLILATHSPSIVLDNTENCIDLIESAA
jgi:predicted ATP-binding protein involved in virulence